MKSQFTSNCRACGSIITPGTEIVRNEAGGWKHAKCPAPKVAVAAEPAKPEVIKQFFSPLPEVAPETTISIFWYDGEYLSAYSPRNLSDELEKAGVAHFVSGWGTEMDDQFLMFAAGMPAGPISREYYEKIGQEDTKFMFTWARVVAYVTPIREAAEKRHAEKMIAKNQKIADAFAGAKATGKPVSIRSWSEECNAPREECNIDHLVEYAMPDGTKKVERSHTW